MEFFGEIIAGYFDQPNNEFSLQKVKHLDTESRLNEEQVGNLYEYLDQHKDQSDGQVITLYDQLMLHLSHEEINQLIEELDEVRALYRI
ncbi:hypothetical protein [Alkalibacillus silvisoli]|uniref:Uncharacterized protein n=1 Tax=Alkalibacillus silvisoli TaxID=392823 RepID=A0ABN1AB84_9BACI